jgi:hypothetical protein
MGVFALTFHDFVHIFRVCQEVPVSGASPPALLRPFIVSRLQLRARETAAKVAAFDDAHVCLLAREIAGYYALVCQGN